MADDSYCGLMRCQIPAEEVTDSWDPYHYPWSGVVAKTPRHGGRDEMRTARFARAAQQRLAGQSFDPDTLFQHDPVTLLDA